MAGTARVAGAVIVNVAAASMAVAWEVAWEGVAAAAAVVSAAACLQVVERAQAFDAGG